MTLDSHQNNVTVKHSQVFQQWEDSDRQMCLWYEKGTQPLENSCTELTGQQLTACSCVLGFCQVLPCSVWDLVTLDVLASM